MKKVSIIVLAALTVIGTGCAGCPGEYNRDVSAGTAAAAQQNREFIGIVYVSEDGQALTACFDTRADTVLVKLPDGREVTLPRSISASGARYSNGETTFWEHHGEGIVQVGDNIIFRGRAAAD
ncbi:MAG: MliC family protein [Deltaproteobacteria bacterium]|nr:MliC family protein [Deltaproteobacteria bacterium]